MSWIKSRQSLLVGLIIVIFINEFTLVVLDDNPPLSDSAIYKIRFFNLVVILLALFYKNNFASLFTALKATSKFTINYVMPVIFTIIAIDIALGLIGFGYPKHYNQENIERYPTPSDTFRGKPNVRDHNNLGFRGDFDDRASSYNVAIFGGSTTYNGSPPIIDLVETELEAQGISVDTFNFGSVSSNHSQHVHRLLEFSDRYRFDLVIFYGGGNESLQYASYDPRPGYPYNFFFRNELAPWKQTLLRISSILGTVDIYSGGFISGLSSLKAEYIDIRWANEIVDNYWRDLALANAITKTIIQPDRCSASKFLSVLQPGNPTTELQIEVWNLLLQSQPRHINSIEWNHADFSNLNSAVQFTDIIHVNQNSKELIASHLASEVNRILSTECK